MALLWIDGFEGFGTTLNGAPTPTGVYGRKYTVQSESGFRVVTGRWSGYALKFVIDTCYFQPPALTTNATMIVGLALKTLNGLNHEFLTFYDGSTRGMNLRWVSGGNLAVYRADTQLAATVGLGLVAGTWYYIEFKVVCNGTTGSYDVHVDGVSRLSATGVNTQAGSHAFHSTFRIQDVWGENPTFDDLYCLDASGSTNNTFLGVKQVVTLYPSAAGDSAQWTPSSGANYAAVDEESMDDDATYIQTSGGADLDLYHYADLIGAGGVSGVQINTDARRTNPNNTMNLYQASKLSATESDGSVAAVAEDTYTTKTRIMETDPTGAAWTPANLNSTQFGVKLGS